MRPCAKEPLGRAIASSISIELTAPGPGTNGAPAKRTVRGVTGRGIRFELFVRTLLPRTDQTTLTYGLALLHEPHTEHCAPRNRATGRDHPRWRGPQLCARPARAAGRHTCDQAELPPPPPPQLPRTKRSGRVRHTYGAIRRRGCAQLLERHLKRIVTNNVTESDFA